MNLNRKKIKRLSFVLMLTSLLLVVYFTLTYGENNILKSSRVEKIYNYFELNQLREEYNDLVQQISYNVIREVEKMVSNKFLDDSIINNDLDSNKKIYIDEDLPKGEIKLGVENDNEYYTVSTPKTIDKSIPMYIALISGCFLLIYMLDKKIV